MAFVAAHERDTKGEPTANAVVESVGLGFEANGIERLGISEYTLTG